MSVRVKEEYDDEEKRYKRQQQLRRKYGGGGSSSGSSRGGGGGSSSGSSGGGGLLAIIVIAIIIYFAVQGFNHQTPKKDSNITEQNNVVTKRKPHTKNHKKLHKLTPFQNNEDSVERQHTSFVDSISVSH